jgi:hypothetical protein
VYGEKGKNHHRPTALRRGTLLTEIVATVLSMLPHGLLIRTQN